MNGKKFKIVGMKGPQAALHLVRKHIKAGKKRK
jgi:hypothetical protein